jgi:hypothetical protein
MYARRFVSEGSSNFFIQFEYPNVRPWIRKIDSDFGWDWVCLIILFNLCDFLNINRVRLSFLAASSNQPTL